MTIWGVVWRFVALALLGASCSSAEPEAAPTTTARPSTTSEATTTTAPERTASTTTTAFDPASIEGQVEAAYLRSWDVYAEAVYHLELDEQALEQVYAGESLVGKLTEIRDRVRDGRAAHVEIDHAYDIIVVDPNTAQVIDRFINHQVLIDPVTKEPAEADPNERLIFNFRVERIDAGWRVTFIERVDL